MWGIDVECHICPVIYTPVLWYANVIFTIFQPICSPPFLQICYIFARSEFEQIHFSSSVANNVASVCAGLYTVNKITVNQPSLRIPSYVLREAQYGNNKSSACTCHARKFVSRSRVLLATARWPKSPRFLGTKSLKELIKGQKCVISRKREVEWMKLALLFSFQYYLVA